MTLVEVDLPDAEISVEIRTIGDKADAVDLCRIESFGHSIMRSSEASERQRDFRPLARCLKRLPIRIPAPRHVGDTKEDVVGFSVALHAETQAGGCVGPRRVEPAADLNKAAVIRRADLPGEVDRAIVGQAGSALADAAHHTIGNVDPVLCGLEVFEDHLSLGQSWNGQQGQKCCGFHGQSAKVAPGLGKAARVATSDLSIFET